MATYPPLSQYPIDRVKPTQRPNERKVMFQRWADLLFLHWIVPDRQLTPLLPPGLTLDTFEGNAYIGLVPFTMTGVRPVWSPPIAPLSNFHETNVRTYVHCEGRDPGVWFFSLDAANALAVRIARAWWKLPYHFAQMSLESSQVTAQQLSGEPEENSGRMISYTTQRLWPDPVPAALEVRYSVTGPVTPAQTGTLEHFLAERYFLYAYANRRLLRGQVHHRPYPLQIAGVHSLNENLVVATGVRRPDEAPLAHYASEVTVDIYPLKTI